jgi:hypothetical protein
MLNAKLSHSVYLFRQGMGPEHHCCLVSAFHPPYLLHPVCLRRLCPLLPHLHPRNPALHQLLHTQPSSNIHLLSNLTPFTKFALTACPNIISPSNARKALKASSFVGNSRNTISEGCFVSALTLRLCSVTETMGSRAAMSVMLAEGGTLCRERMRPGSERDLGCFGVGGWA